MPVRKIKKNHVSVTGLHVTQKSRFDAEFESPAERDYMILLDFDDAVAHYEVQPVRVPVPGVPRGYVPDLLVHFKPDTDGVARPSELIEVKTANDYLENAQKYAPKFAAADVYAQERGWCFVLATAEHFRTTRLKNLKFLRAFVRQDLDHDKQRAVIHQLRRLGGRSTSNAVLSHLAPTLEEQAHYTPVLWNLVATFQILTDLDAPFSNDIPIWLRQEDP